MEYTTEPTLYGNVISQHRDGQTSYFHHDGIGNTITVTDDNGDVTDTRAYSAFGEITESSGTTEFPFQFVGQKGYYRDAETGANLVRRRPYEPVVARWSSADPLFFVNGTNLYQYVNNRPTYHVDPSGTQCWWSGRIWKHATLQAVVFWGRSAVNPDAAITTAAVVDAIEFGEDVFDTIPGPLKPPIGVSPGIGKAGKALAEKVKGLYGALGKRDGVRIWVKMQCKSCYEVWNICLGYWTVSTIDYDLAPVWYLCEAEGSDPALLGAFDLEKEYDAIVKAIPGCVSEAWLKADCKKSSKLPLGKRK